MADSITFRSFVASFVIRVAKFTEIDFRTPVVARDIGLCDVRYIHAVDTRPKKFPRRISKKNRRG